MLSSTTMINVNKNKGKMGEIIKDVKEIEAAFEDVKEIEAGLKWFKCSIVGEPVTETTKEQLKWIDKMYDHLVMLKKNMTEESERRWSELPNEIVELILKKLMPSEFDLVNFKYFLSFKAVCHSWRTAAESYSSLYAQLPQTPWLLHHPHNNIHITATLFDPIGNEVYKIESIYNNLHKAWCAGTSHGWMIMFHEDEYVSPSPSFVLLVNPISKAKIQIPNYPKSYPQYDISKGIISSDPGKNINFLVVLAKKNDGGGLAVYKNIDKSWGKLSEALGYTYDDILFHDNKLFASIGAGQRHINLLEIWDCSEFIPVKIMNVQDSPVPERLISTHLVVSLAGEVVRMKSISVDSYGSEPTGFVVEKLDLINKKWDSMHDLGDQSLFLYYDQLMSLSSPCFLGSEVNSIYFAIPCIYNWSLGQKIGTYNLKEKTMRGSVDFVSLISKYHDRFRVELSPGWIVPNPW